MIRFEVDADLFGIEEARRNLSKVDPQVQAALGYFDEARQLLAHEARQAASPTSRGQVSACPNQIALARLRPSRRHGAPAARPRRRSADTPTLP